MKKFLQSLKNINYRVFIALIVVGLVPTLTGIALMFGIGVAFDSIVSLCAYVFLLKKNKINILDVESRRVE